MKKYLMVVFILIITVCFLFSKDADNSAGIKVETNNGTVYIDEAVYRKVEDGVVKGGRLLYPATLNINGLKVVVKKFEWVSIDENKNVSFDNNRFSLHKDQTIKIGNNKIPFSGIDKITLRDGKISRGLLSKKVKVKLGDFKIILKEHSHVSFDIDGNISESTLGAEFKYKNKKNNVIIPDGIPFYFDSKKGDIAFNIGKKTIVLSTKNKTFDIMDRIIFTKDKKVKTILAKNYNLEQNGTKVIVRKYDGVVLNESGDLENYEYYTEKARNEEKIKAFKNTQMFTLDELVEMFTTNAHPEAPGMQQYFGKPIVLKVQTNNKSIVSEKPDKGEVKSILNLAKIPAIYNDEYNDKITYKFKSSKLLKGVGSLIFIINENIEKVVKSDILSKKDFYSFCYLSSGSDFDGSYKIVMFEYLSKDDFEAVN